MISIPLTSLFSLDEAFKHHLRDEGIASIYLFIVFFFEIRHFQGSMAVDEGGY